MTPFQFYIIANAVALALAIRELFNDWNVS